MSKKSIQVQLNNVRLSYPVLWTPQIFKSEKKEKQPQETNQESRTPKFSATFILDNKKNSEDIRKMEEAIDGIVNEVFHGNTKVLASKCLRDGEERVEDDGSFKDGYGPGISFVPSSSFRKPKVVGRNPNIPLSQEDGVIYAGCYVNALINVRDAIYVEKRICANLLAIQFVKDGDPFGEDRVDVDVNEVFNNLSGGDKEDSDTNLKNLLD